MAIELLRDLMERSSELTPAERQSLARFLAEQEPGGNGDEDKNAPPSAGSDPHKGQLSIEWHDANGAEAGRLWSPSWDASLSTTEWTKFEVSGAAPANAAKAHCVIVEKGQGQPLPNCVFLADDASVVKVGE